MKIVHEISLDLVNQTEIPRIRVKQGDTYTHQVALNLTTNGESWTIPDGAAPVIRYKATDLDTMETVQGIYDTLADGIAAWEISGSSVTVTLVPQMTASYGTVQTDVAFILGEKVLATCTFEIYVNRSPSVGTETAAQSYYNVVTLAQINEQFEKVVGICQELDMRKLDNSGGTMEGDLCMNGNRITQLASPKDDGDAAGKGYVDQTLSSIQAEMLNYGLGAAKDVGAQELNGLTRPGWYRIPGDVTVGGMTFAGAYLRVDSYDWAYCAQALYPLSDTMTSLRRLCWNGQWQDWEWEEPPLESGVEYRTTRRWDSSPVYVKKCNFGSLPNASTAQLDTGCQEVILVGLEGVAYDSDGNGFSLTLCPGVRAVLSASGILEVTTNSDLSAYKACFTLVYAK